MALYSLSLDTPMFGSNYRGPYYEVVPSALSRIALMQFGFSVQVMTNNNMSVGIGQPATPGSQYQYALPYLPHDPGDAPALTQGCAQWGNPPGTATQFFRRFVASAIQANTGFDWNWVFPRGLRNALANSLTFAMLFGSANTQCSFFINSVVNE